jgi:hypothetical protein
MRVMTQLTKAHHRILLHAQDGLSLAEILMPFVVTGDAGPFEVFPAADLEEMLLAAVDLVRRGDVNVREAFQGERKLGPEAEHLLTDPANCGQSAPRHEIWDYRRRPPNLQ